jgi:hypothetical protein
VRQRLRDGAKAQIAVACNHLREFEGNSRFAFDAIGRFFGGRKGEIIKA